MKGTLLLAILLLLASLAGVLAAGCQEDEAVGSIYARTKTVTVPQAVDQDVETDPGLNTSKSLSLDQGAAITADSSSCGEMYESGYDEGYGEGLDQNGQQSDNFDSGYMLGYEKGFEEGYRQGASDYAAPPGF